MSAGANFQTNYMLAVQLQGLQQLRELASLLSEIASYNSKSVDVKVNIDPGSLKKITQKVEEAAAKATVSPKLGQTGSGSTGSGGTVNLSPKATAALEALSGLPESLKTVAAALKQRPLDKDSQTGHQANAKAELGKIELHLKEMKETLAAIAAHGGSGGGGGTGGRRSPITTEVETVANAERAALEKTRKEMERTLNAFQSVVTLNEASIRTQGQEMRAWANLRRSMMSMPENRGKEQEIRDAINLARTRQGGGSRGYDYGAKSWVNAVDNAGEARTDALSEYSSRIKKRVTALKMDLVDQLGEIEDKIASMPATVSRPRVTGGSYTGAGQVAFDMKPIESAFDRIAKNFAATLTAAFEKIPAAVASVTQHAIPALAANTINGQTVEPEYQYQMSGREQAILGDYYTRQRELGKLAAARKEQMSRAKQQAKQAAGYYNMSDTDLDMMRRGAPAGMVPVRSGVLAVGDATDYGYAAELEYQRSLQFRSGTNPGAEYSLSRPPRADQSVDRWARPDDPDFAARIAALKSSAAFVQDHGRSGSKRLDKDQIARRIMKSNERIAFMKDMAENGPDNVGFMSIGQLGRLKGSWTRARSTLNKAHKAYEAGDQPPQEVIDAIAKMGDDPILGKLVGGGTNASSVRTARGAVGTEIKRIDEILERARFAQHDIFGTVAGRSISPRRMQWGGTPGEDGRTVNDVYRTITPFNAETLTDPNMRKKALRHVAELQASGWNFQPLEGDDQIAQYRVSSLMRSKLGQHGQADRINRFLEEGGEWYQTQHGFKGFRAAENLFDLKSENHPMAQELLEKERRAAKGADSADISTEKLAKAVDDLANAKLDPIVAAFKSLAEYSGTASSNLSRINVATGGQMGNIMQAAQYENLARTKAGLKDTSTQLRSAEQIKIMERRFDLFGNGINSGVGADNLSAARRSLGERLRAGVTGFGHDDLGDVTRGLSAISRTQATVERLAATAEAARAHGVSDAGFMKPYTNAAFGYDAALTGLMGPAGRLAQKYPNQLGDVLPMLSTWRDVRSSRDADASVAQRYDAASTRLGNGLLSKGERSKAEAEMVAATAALEAREVKTLGELNQRIAQRTELEGQLKKSIAARVSQEKEGIAAEENSVGFLSRLGSKMKSLFAYSIAMTALYTTFNMLKQAFTGAENNQLQSTEIAGMRGGGSLDERLRIKDETIKAARDYGAAISDVFAITREFIREGLPLDEAMQRTRAVLTGTQALGLNRDVAREVLQANESITGGLTSGGEIMDKIAKVSSNNPVSADDMATAIMRVAPIMSQMMPQRLGQMDPMDAAMGSATAIIEKTRVSGQSAATSLSMILGRLLSPAVGKQLQNNFGVMLGGATPNEMRPVTDIMTDLSARYKQLNASGHSVQANELLQELGGPRQVNATAALLSGWDRAMAVSTQSQTAFGEAQRKLAVEMDTESKQRERLQSAWNGFTDRLLEVTHILPILSTSFKAMTAILSLVSGRFHIGGTNVFSGDLTQFDGRAIENSDLVQDYKKQAASLSLTPQGLRAAVLSAVSGAKSSVAGEGWFKAAGLTEDNVFGSDNGKTNRRLSAATTKELVAQLDKTVPGFKELGDEAKRASIALKLVSDTQAQSNVFLGIRVGDLADRMSKSTESVTEQFARAINGGAFTNGPSQIGAQQLYDIRSGTYHLGGGKYSRSKTLSDFHGVLSSQFGSEFTSAIDGGSKGFQFSQGGTFISRAVDAMEKMPHTIQNFGQALDYVTQTMLTFSPEQQAKYDAALNKTPRIDGESMAAYEMRVAGGLTGATNTVGVNRAMFDMKIREAMQQGFGVDHMAREAIGAQAGKNGLTLGAGGVFQQEVVSSMIRQQSDIVNYLKQHGMSAEAGALSRTLGVIGNDANRQKSFAALLDTGSGKGTMKERLLDALIQTSVKSSQVRTLSGVFGDIGIDYNANKEREGIARDLVTNLSGIRAQTEGDWMKAVLKQHNLQTSDIDPSAYTDSITGRQVAGSDLKLSLRGARAGLNAEQGAALKRNVDLAQQMVAELDSKDIKSMPKPLQDWVQNFQKNGYNTQVSDFGLNLPKLQEWAKAFLASTHAINDALDDQLKLIKRESDLEQQQLVYSRDRAKATGDYRVRMAELISPYSGGAMRMQNLSGDQMAQRAIVEATYQTVVRTLNATTDSKTLPGERAAYLNSSEYKDTLQKARDARKLGLIGADNTARGSADDMVMAAKEQALAARQTDLLDLLKQIVQPMKDFLKSLLDDPRHFKGNRAAEVMVPQMASALNSRISSHVMDSLFGEQTKVGKALTNMFGMSDTMLQQETIRKGVYSGTLDAMRDVFGPQAGGKGTGSTSTSMGAFLGIGAMVGGGLLAKGGVSNGASALEHAMSTGGYLTEEQAAKLTPAEKTAAIKAGKLDQNGHAISGRQQFGMMAAQLGGQIGGSIIAGRMHKGYNYGAEGSSFGSTLGGGLGMMVGGPAGAMLGSLLGGLAGGTLGGLFHKKLPPHEAPEFVALEKIERNTRETITAIENSTKSLANLDTRFLNAPASFSVPGYRPMNVGSGMGASPTLYQDNRTVQIDVHDATDPAKVALAVQQALAGDMRGAGTFLTMRTSN